jgi:hypothetical protein
MLIGVWVSLALFWAGVGVLLYGYLARWRDGPPAAVTFSMMFVAVLLTAMSVATTRRLSRTAARMQDLEEAYTRRLPEEARNLLNLPPKTFYFLDTNAVEELGAQILGRLQPVELRETRRRGHRFGASAGTPGAVAVSGEMQNGAEQETRSAARKVHADEFNRVLEDMILRDQIRFGLDQLRPSEIPSPRRRTTVDSSASKAFAEAIASAIEAQARKPDGGLDKARVKEITTNLLDGFRLANVTEGLREAAECAEYVFLAGQWTFRLRDDYVELTCLHVGCMDAREITIKPQFLMRLRHEVPPLTLAGDSVFTADCSGRANLRCLAKAVSWEPEQRTLYLTPIAIF